MKTYLKDFYKKKVFDSKKALLGEVYGILLNINNTKIEGFVLKKSFINFDYFLLDNILNINDNIYLNDNNKKNEKKVFYDLITLSVYNQDGKYIGNIIDVDFDVFYNLKNIYVNSGFFFISKINTKKNNYRKINKKNILKFGENYIIINDKNSCLENKKTLENISKIFINIKNPSYNINKKKYD